MPSRMIQPRKNGSDVDKLNPQQRLFVEYLLADVSFNGAVAARKAGYKNPAGAATRLLKQRRVAAVIGKAIGQRITRCQLTADEVLEHLRQALFFDPLELFQRTANGAYEVRNLEDVPVEIRRLITKFKCKTKTTEKGTDTWIEVEMMSKDAALPLAMKHLGIIDALGNTVNVNVGSDVISSLLKQVEQDRKVIDVNYIESKGV